MAKSDYYEGHAFMYQYYRGNLNVCPGTITLVRDRTGFNNRVFIRARDKKRFNFHHTSAMEMPDISPGGSVRCTVWSPVRTQATDDRFVEIVVQYLKDCYARAKAECAFYDNEWYVIRTAQRDGSITFRER